MNEEQTPLEESREPSPIPERIELHTPSSSGRGLKIAAILLTMAAGFAGTYGWEQHRAARELAFNRDQLSASLDQTRREEAALAANLDALHAAQTAAATAPAAGVAAHKNAQVLTPEGAPPKQTSHRAAAPRAHAEDPRWKQLQDQLSSQQKELTEDKQLIAETQTNLQQARSELESNIQSTRDELGNDIARNHEQLVALEKKGERNYYEFDIQKSKSYHHTGPISIALRKTSDKHQYCDLDMVINDTELSRKHMNLYESVSFYPEGYPLPLEVVINRIGEDYVHGYVSEPKYRPATAQAVAAPAALPTAATTTASSTPDPKLEHRPDEAH